MTDTANPVLENGGEKLLKMTAEDETVIGKPVENGFAIEKELDDSFMEDDAASLKLQLSDDEDESNQIHASEKTQLTPKEEPLINGIDSSDDILKSIDEVLNDEACPEEKQITENIQTEEVEINEEIEKKIFEEKIEIEEIDSEEKAKIEEEISKELMEGNSEDKVEEVLKEVLDEVMEEEEVLKEVMETESSKPETVEEVSEKSVEETKIDLMESEQAEEDSSTIVEESNTEKNIEEEEKSEESKIEDEKLEEANIEEDKSEDNKVEELSEDSKNEEKIEEIIISTVETVVDQVENVPESSTEIEQTEISVIQTEDEPKQVTDNLEENSETEPTEKAPVETIDSLIVVNMELTEEKNRELEEENIEDLDKPEDEESDEKESEQDDENVTTAATSTDITEDEDLSQDTNDIQPKIIVDEETEEPNTDFPEETQNHTDEEIPTDDDIPEKRKISETEDDPEAKRPKIDEIEPEVDMDIETDVLSTAISMSIGTDEFETIIEPSQTPTPDLLDMDLLKKRPLEEEPSTPEPKKQKIEEPKPDFDKKPEKKREKLILQMLPKIFKDENIPDIDIEEFILTKLIEAISQRTELAQLRFKTQKQETVIEQLRKKTVHLNKQLEDIATVTNRLSIDLQHKDRPVAPVKITRSVGLQVAMPLAQVKRYNPPPAPPKPRQQKPKPQQKVVPLVPPAKPATTPVKITQVPKTPPTILNKTLNRPSPNLVNKNTNTKPVIDLTDEDDNKKAPTPSLIPINAGNIRIVPSSTANSQPNMYLMTTGGAMGQNRQLLIATSGSNVVGQRPTMVNQVSRGQTQTPVRYMIHNANGQTALVPQRPGVVLANGVRSVPVRMNTPIRTQNRVVASHPAALPIMLDQPNAPGWRQIPPRPTLKIGRAKDGGIQLSWSMPELDNKIHEDVASYQLYAYQEGTAPPSSDLWRKVGDVKALPLPMACTLTSFHPGNKYYFAVRAIDVHSRVSLFSYAQPISLLN